MKNYLLPTLISLALSTSPWAFAQSEAAGQAETTPPPATTEPVATTTPAAETTPPVVTSTTTVTSSTATTDQSPATTDQSTTDQSTKDQAPATPPTVSDTIAKRQAFRQQMQEQMEKVRNAKTPEERQQLMEEFDQVMQQHRQEMWGGDWNSSPPYRGGDYDDMRGRGDYAPPPAWGDDMPPPAMPPYGYGPPRGYYGGNDRPYTGRRGGMSPRGGFSSQQQAHQEAMEQRLENIEKLLTEIVKALPKQPETK